MRRRKNWQKYNYNSRREALEHALRIITSSLKRDGRTDFKGVEAFEYTCPDHEKCRVLLLLRGPLDTEGKINGHEGMGGMMYEFHYKYRGKNENVDKDSILEHEGLRRHKPLLEDMFKAIGDSINSVGMMTLLLAIGELLDVLLNKKNDGGDV